MAKVTKKPTTTQTTKKVLTQKPLPTAKSKAKPTRVVAEPLDETRSLAASDPINLYLSEIKKYPLLAKEEELELTKKYFESKDPLAAEKLIKSNLRFVVKVAADYSKYGAKLIDLIQEGNIGLMHAVKEFNPYKGVRLITYAVWWIRGHIQEYLMKQFSMVKIGTTHNQKKLFYNLQKEQQALNSIGQATDFAALSEKFGIPEDEIREMSKRLSGRDVSLNQPMDGDSSSTLIDVQASRMQDMDEMISHQEELDILKDKIAEIRTQLNERELFILENRLLSEEPMTLQEIGTKYGTTREAVRQMEERVMRKLRDLVKPSIE